ncbi:hypothetical protein S7711_10487 [Stachybotrys chartarum IBT 7711]|uniref:Uncharacterized protein n=1 Tax=Stachybotrys chartarum (strain CBS 109288 / IBT 7711) TaxID=1280523 RepID=A0A084BC82_STACB|nr:hypothetical protein S7711_10487 [Stachybotrys chartarum IBT 7711]
MADKDKGKPKPDPGALRARDMNQIYLNIPGYADDSMLFVIRYGAKAELSKADLEAFRGSMGELLALARRTDLDAIQRAARAKEVREAILERIKYAPELVRDVDQFFACLSAAKKAAGVEH